MTNHTVTQDELDEMADEFLNHWPYRHLIESVSPTTGETVTYTATDGSQRTMRRTDTFDAAYDRVANWTRTMDRQIKEAKQPKMSRDAASFAAFESAALGEW